MSLLVQGDPKGQSVYSGLVVLEHQYCQRKGTQDFLGEAVLKSKLSELLCPAGDAVPGNAQTR